MRPTERTRLKVPSGRWGVSPVRRKALWVAHQDKPRLLAPSLRVAKPYAKRYPLGQRRRCAF